MIEIIHTIEQIAVIFGMFALVGMAVLISMEISNLKTTHKLAKLSGTPSIGATNNTIFGTMLNNKEKVSLLLFGRHQRKLRGTFFPDSCT